MMYTAIKNQSLYDICLLTYGTFDGLSKLVGDNNGLDINSEIKFGTNIYWDETYQFDKKNNITKTASTLNLSTVARQERSQGLPYKLPFHFLQY
jgi:hypothetical protein